MSKKIGCGGFRIDDDTLKLKEDGTLYAAGGGGGVQPDWNQNDSTATDYIKNRPFYTGDPVETVLVEESTASFVNSNGLYVSQFPSTFKATVGETYKVTWDGTVYECACLDHGGSLFIGNLSIAGGGSDTGEPFLMGVANGRGIEIYTKDTSASHTISISAFVSEVTQIPDKYISNTFRDVIIAGYPLHWSENDWIKYYGLFQSGKLLMINGIGSSNSTGYVLSMDYVPRGAHDISVMTSHGYLYSLGRYQDGEEDKSYWAPIISYGAFYFQYDETESYPSSVNREAYERLEMSAGSLTFTTKNANQEAVRQKVVLEGDKEITLSSSTSGSLKKFKITVDDSGNLTATEI